MDMKASQPLLQIQVISVESNQRQITLYTQSSLINIKTNLFYI